MELIDTHAHLYVEQFESDLVETIARAKDEHVVKVVLPNIDGDTSQKLIDLYQSDKDFFSPMMGLHPCAIDENYKKVLDQIEVHFLRQDFVSVGEIGLDYYWDTSKKKEQQDAFITQLRWGKERKLPVAIHCRDSFDDVLDILEQEQDGSLQGVLHCFTGNSEQAQRLIDLGFYLGIGGVLTFKNSGLGNVLKNIDLKHMVLETDAPYLSPVPFRGKRNESSYLIYIAEKLTELKECKIEELALITTQNARDLFSIN
jgi:TatD DNase family protein